ncbi:hypothetical protein ANO11243_088230 [Dothideomycetidae sp. 11243]|nr:hypothetical protein ANO11243_088230 [fungal sp. No.11243]
MPEKLPDQALLLVGEQRVVSPIQAHTFKHEARTDLVAFVTEADDVYVYRLGGQLLHRVEVHDLSGKATCLEWARGGEILLIGTDSGIVDILILNNGRINSGKTPKDDHAVAVTGIGCHILQPRPHSQHGAPTRDATLMEQQPITQWLKQPGGSPGSFLYQGGAEEIISLPRSLATIDLNDALPKLSVIPGPSKAGPGMPAPVLRTAQKDLHSLLNSKTSQNADAFEITFTCLSDESVEIAIGDLFQHTFRKKGGKQGRFISQHASPASGFHAVIVKDAHEAEQEQAAISGLSISLYQDPFSNSESVHTGTVLGSATQLQRLSLYIGQCIDTACLDWNTLTALPGRFIANINDTLEENSECALQGQFTQLLLTGHCSETVGEWLKEELQERGYKRWDLAMTTFYHSITQLLEINLLPALEKSALYASTLRGLASYYEGSQKFDVQPKYMTKILQVLESLYMLAHEALQILATEQTGFLAFSKWLKIRVDVAASEPGSATFTELVESEATSTDAPLVLSYLTNTFISSKMAPIIGRKMSPAEMDAKTSDSKSSKDDTVVAIKALRQSASDWKDALHLPLQMRRLDQAVNTCLMQMKRWQSTTWPSPSEVNMAFDRPQLVQDVQVYDRVSGAGRGMTIAVLGIDAEQPTQLNVHHLPLRYHTKTAAMATEAPHKTAFRLPDNGIISSAVLLRDGSMVLLRRCKSKQKLFHISKSQAFGENSTLSMSEQDLEKYTAHDFTADDTFIPAHLYVSEGQRRTNIAVLDESRRMWRVLRLSGHVVEPEEMGSAESAAQAPGRSTLDVLGDDDSMELE